MECYEGDNIFSVWALKYTLTTMINFDDTDGEERDDLEEACADQESEEYDPTSSNHQLMRGPSQS